VSVRERAAATIPEWGHVRFTNEALSIERLIQQGKLQLALKNAWNLQKKAKAVGQSAYNEAAKDLAMATNLLAQVLNASGQINHAYTLFVEAQHLFEALGKEGECNALNIIVRQADCLTKLGRIDEAIKAYDIAGRKTIKLGNLRQSAVIKSNIGIAFCRQDKFVEAISVFHEARKIFERLNEPLSVADIWHNIGNAHLFVKRYDDAEEAYCRSIEIETQANDRVGQAKTLNQLGYLYYILKRLDEALKFFRLSNDIYVEQENLFLEGIVRNNIAKTLLKLERYDEARKEINLSIDCKNKFSHAAEQWEAFNILYKIETKTLKHTAAKAAWVRARNTYFSYRQQGGNTPFGGTKLIDDVLNLIAQQKNNQIQALFDQINNDPNVSDSLKKLIKAVISILNGARDTTLADNPALDYADAAEILYLIDRLEASP
jgi:tetratricopeptide (TPR) repeat protein